MIISSNNKNKKYYSSGIRALHACAFTTFWAHIFLIALFETVPTLKLYL